MPRPRLTRAAGSLLLSLVAGCGERPCPSIASAAVELEITNGAQDGECLYEVVLTGPSGRADVECSVSGDTCTCQGGQDAGEYVVDVRVRLFAGGSLEYAQLRAEVEVSEECTLPFTEHLSYVGVPVEELSRPPCLAAQEKLASCDLPPRADCVQEGLRLRALALQGDDDGLGQVVDCLDRCDSEPSCGELRHDRCAPASEITDYERCWIDCGGGDEDDYEQYGPEMGPSDACPSDGAGGAGGDGG